MEHLFWTWRYIINNPSICIMLDKDEVNTTSIQWTYQRISKFNIFNLLDLQWLDSKSTLVDVVYLRHQYSQIIVKVLGSKVEQCNAEMIAVLNGPLVSVESSISLLNLSVENENNFMNSELKIGT